MSIGTATNGPGKLSDLEECAADHLGAYMDPNSDYAFHTYDRQGNPDRLEPVDLLAPALLSVPIRPAWVRDLFKPTGPGSVLLTAMQAVLNDPACRTADFIDLDLNTSGPWMLVDAAVYASRDAVGIKGVAVTKTLHRKRPNLVPVLDGFVYGFYMGHDMPDGPYGDTPRRFWPVLHRELNLNRDWLAKVADGRETPDQRPVSVLRAADIVVWMHVKTGCNGNPGT